MKKLFFILAVFLEALQLSAQAANVFPLPPVIRVNVSDADKNSIRLSELSADVQVVGNVATTTIDMIFTNSSSRILEGEFEFPLSEGQTVCGYALDINGKMREGVVVEKEKGRTVFEEVVRRNVDPALIEMTSGNNFKTRVYPLPAKGSRHIRISYEETLNLIQVDSSKKIRKYILQPLTSEPLDSFDFKINIFNSENELKLSSEDDFTLNSAYNGSFSKKNWSFEKPVQISIPDTGSNLTFTQEKGKDTYFYCTIPVLPQSRAKTLPKKLVVFYDISSSMKERNFDLEMQLLKSYAKKLDKCEIFVVPFCNEIHSMVKFNGNDEESLRELEIFLKSQVYDGASNLDYDFEKMFDCDEVLIFSDGISNWKNPSSSKDKNDSLAKKAVVNTINSCASADHSKLLSLAQSSGGVYINLCTKSVNQGIDLLTSESLRLISMEYNQNEADELYPKAGHVVQDEFSLSGILKKKDAIVKLKFGYGNTIVQELSLPLTSVTERKNLQSQNISRLWAEKKIDFLNSDYEKNKDEILETAKKFTIVTKGTSLIVLDSVSDYLRYGIEPPEELLAEYERLASGTSASKSGTNEEAVPEKVYRYFETFKNWWKTPSDEFKKNPRKEKGSIAPAVSRTFSSHSAVNGSQTFEQPVTEEVFAATSDAAARTSSRAALTTKPDNEENHSLTNNSIISIQAWNPDAKYLSELKRTAKEKMYQKYLELKKENESSPSFYMECAQYFWEEDLKNEALRILSNLAEMNLENTDVLRALGNKLCEFGINDLAVIVFKKLTKLRPELPQFFRDYALASYAAGNAQESINSLYHIVKGNWDTRYDEIQMIALNDMNAIIEAENRAGREINTDGIDKKLLENFPVDIRVVLTWNTDNCDIDLWVTDPASEKCYYSHKITQSGGRISRDFTQGYGPEEFCIREALKGKYKIQANYYGTSSQKILQPVIVQAEVYTNFGKPNQEKKLLTLQLENVKGTFTVGEVEF